LSDQPEVHSTSAHQTAEPATGNMKAYPVHIIAYGLATLMVLLVSVWASPCQVPPPTKAEYLWYEAENMRGITQNARHEPLLNPSYLELPASKAPGWAISGPGVSAEWSQGGESEWNSVAASPDETSGVIWQELEVPRAGQYQIWVRYADFANKTEFFVVSISQEGREILRHEFGARDQIDPHDETSMYWGWAFAWDAAQATLTK